MGASALHQRMAELWTIRRSRSLTKEERELEICLDANISYCWRMSALENMSLMASMTDDHDWLHRLCAQMEQWQYGGRDRKRKT